MDEERNEAELKKAVLEVVQAEKYLRELADRIKGYPEAAQRLGEVSSALDRAASGLQSAARAVANHETAMQQVLQRINNGIERMETMRSSILDAIESVAATLDRQAPLLQKAAGKRGIVF